MFTTQQLACQESPASGTQRDQAVTDGQQVVGRICVPGWYGVYAVTEQHLAPVHVADAGRHALVHQQFVHRPGAVRDSAQRQVSARIAAQGAWG